MSKSSRNSVIFPTSCLICCLALLLAPTVRPQQTLGGITGTITDSSGGALTDSQVTLVADATKFTRIHKTGNLRVRKSSHRFLHPHVFPRWLRHPENSFHPRPSRSHRNRKRHSQG